MYSTSIVDKATIVCKVAFQLISQSPIVKTYLVRDLLLSWLPAKSESTYPTTPSLVLPKCKKTLVEPYKYLKIHLIAFQCSLPRFAMYLLIALTTYDKFGHEQTIAYMRDPIALEYGTRDI